MSLLFLMENHLLGCCQVPLVQIAQDLADYRQAEMNQQKFVNYINSQGGSLAQMM